MTDPIKLVREERQATYGSFEGNAKVTQKCERVFREHSNWDKVDSVYREAAHMIIQKLSRAFCGHTTHKDSWVDIQGYAQCVLDYIDEGIETKEF